VKFYPNQLQKIANSISCGKIKSALLHGPDSGLIEYSILELGKLLNLTRKSLSYDNISFSELNSALNNISLFADKELIAVKNMPSNPDANTKSLFDKEHHNILVIGAGELSPSSPLRKLYESGEELASIGCYNDDEKSIEQIIRTYLVKESKSISPDAMKYLKSQLHGDRFIIINELEKLFCYLADKKEIKLEDAEKIISSPTALAPDRLCLYFMLGSDKNFFHELDKAISNNIPAIWIIRALTRYYINAYYTLVSILEGTDEDKALSSCPNPIFFKYKPAFKKAISTLTKAKVVKSLDALYKAEKQVKEGNKEYKDILLNCFFLINHPA